MRRVMWVEHQRTGVPPVRAKRQPLDRTCRKADNNQDQQEQSDTTFVQTVQNHPSYFIAAALRIRGILRKQLHSAQRLTGRVPVSLCGSLLRWTTCVSLREECAVLLSLHSHPQG